jgi:flavin reductase (DIM6/NTAB) family NADH-FMN oxidoreductase RutF
MEFEKVDPFKFVKETNEHLRGGGLFLVSGSLEAREKAEKNVMTIGWGFIGTMWAMPVFIVAVRHSRHTFKLMEDSKSWTVCVPSKDMGKALEFCGEKSGRDVDKFKEMNFTPKKGFAVDAPYIDECPVHYECAKVLVTDMKPGQLIPELEKQMYKTKDMHMIYFGEVRGAYASKDASKLL